MDPSDLGTVISQLSNTGIEAYAISQGAVVGATSTPLGSVVTVGGGAASSTTIILILVAAVALFLFYKR